MDSTVKTPVTLLGLAGIMDIASGPFLIGEGVAVGVAAILFGVITLAAAVGLARRAGWARGVGIATRVIDGLLALPGLAVGGLAAVGAGAVFLVSAAAVIALVRMARRPALA